MYLGDSHLTLIHLISLNPFNGLLIRSFSKLIAFFCIIFHHNENCDLYPSKLLLYIVLKIRQNGSLALTTYSVGIKPAGMKKPSRSWVSRSSLTTSKLCGKLIARLLPKSVINLVGLALSLVPVSLAQELSLTLETGFVTWSFESFLSRSRYL